MGFRGSGVQISGSRPLIAAVRRRFPFPIPFPAPFQKDPGTRFGLEWNEKETLSVFFSHGLGESSLRTRVSCPLDLNHETRPAHICLCNLEAFETWKILEKIFDGVLWRRNIAEVDP